jgi:predicted CXXCH cytochrome family protein
VIYSAGTDKCAACHRTHTSTGETLRKAWPEENLCFGCHISGGSGANIQPAFASYSNTASGYFKHDISATNGNHQRGETSGTAFGGANRHVECEDCHSPHKATRGAASPPMLQRVMTGEAGVDPVWNAAGVPTGYNFLTQAEREHQVCFKCHSGFTTLPNYSPDGWNGTGSVANGLAKLTSTNAQQIKDSRDLAQEFNPYNASFHPVTAQGRNQAIPAGSWVAGWSQTSMIYCSDCHNNANSGSQGIGPHGSPLLHILVGAANNGGQVNYTTVTKTSNASPPSSQELCFKCHAAGTYLSGANSGSTTNFRKGATENLHTKHSQEGLTCYSCHDTHGSEQEHLINFEIGPRLSVPAGRTTQTAWFAAAGTQHGCALTCHGKPHNGDTSADFRYP